ncbi:hypothetical protein TrRE_jg1252 [Triparma retinervis]|uniref:RING-type E3 ubiquitin transferase n=1 Tax=Triparma retinervis TaxID=2557542 RepID=A0A9W6ZRA7_9STRA|nr:hypothetical protein TrRE_jg1252 [Triparma retinervis]
MELLNVLNEYDSEDEYTFISGPLQEDPLGSSLKDFEDCLRCPICHSFLSIPLMTPCSHTFCSTCIRSSIRLSVAALKGKSSRATCPVCREDVDERKLQPAKNMVNIVSKFKGIRKQLVDRLGKGGGAGVPEQAAEETEVTDHITNLATRCKRRDEMGGSKADEEALRKMQDKMKGGQGAKKTGLITPLTNTPDNPALAASSPPPQLSQANDEEGKTFKTRPQSPGKGEAGGVVETTEPLPPPPASKALKPTKNRPPASTKRPPPPTLRNSSDSDSITGPWDCPRCTYHNSTRTNPQAKCEMCDFERKDIIRKRRRRGRRGAKEDRDIVVL